MDCPKGWSWVKSFIAMMIEAGAMRCTAVYQSPLGAVTLASDGECLTGLWFEGQEYFALGLDAGHEERDLPVFRQAGEWLDLYFSGVVPAFAPPLRFTGTPFQNEVWEILATIPYGETRTYGDLAGELARRRGLDRMSSRAVGGAVGKNRISILVPCHRVVGANGDLTGYAGGIRRKRALLRLEGALRDEPFGSG